YFHQARVLIPCETALIVITIQRLELTLQDIACQGPAGLLPDGTVIGQHRIAVAARLVRNLVIVVSPQIAERECIRRPVPFYLFLRRAGSGIETYGLDPTV